MGKLKSLSKNFLNGVLLCAAMNSSGCTDTPIELDNPDKRLLTGYLGIPKDFPIKPFLAPTFEYEIGRPIDKLYNVPERMRFVPVHRDDWGIPGIIEEKWIRAPPLVEFGLGKLGLEAEILKGVHLQAFGGISINFNYFFPEMGDLNERNYRDNTGSNRRGYGAALTAWGATYGPAAIPSLGAELYIDLGKMEANAQAMLILGGRYREYNLEVVNGWDRYDSFEEYQDYHIADIIERAAYIGLGIMRRENLAAGFKIGMAFNGIREETNEINIDANKPSFFGGCFGEIKF